jgi:fibronectin type 3 domain-containing protein
MINSSLNSTTAYTDSTVVSGQTYYYVATTVDGSSNESGYSNQAQAVIPNPVSVAPQDRQFWAI